jgi:hypothetical protein
LSYPEKYLFIIMDGMAIEGDLTTFAYFNVNDKLAKLIPKYIWTSRLGQKVNFFEKLRMANASQTLLKQNLNEFLQDISLRFKKDLVRAFTIEGQKIKNLLQVPLSQRILVVSDRKNFQGIKNVNIIDQMMNTGRSTGKWNEGGASEVKVQEWLQSACISWVKNRFGLSQGRDSPIRYQREDLEDQANRMLVI